MKQMSLFAFSMKVVLKRWFQYGKHRFLRIFSVFIREAYGLALLAFLGMAAGELGGWNIYELFFMQSAISISYAGFLFFFTELRNFNAANASGARLLANAMLKPHGVLFQILLSDCDWFALVGHGILGVICFGIACTHCQIMLTPERIIILLLNLCGAVIIQGAIALFISALNYFAKPASKFRNLLFWFPRLFLRYPLTWFPTWMGNIFVYVVPFAFVSYFPTLYLLGRTDPAYPAWFCYASLPIGMAYYLFAYIIWRIGLRHYLDK